MTNKEKDNYLDDIDVCKTLLTCPVSYDKNQVTWIEIKDNAHEQRRLNSVKLIVDAINMDYHKTLEETQILSANYLDLKLTPKEYADCYCFLLSKVHPYFIVNLTYSSFPTNNLTPGVIFSCYEIVYKIMDLIRNGNYWMIYGVTAPEKVLSDYISPIIYEMIIDKEYAEKIIGYFIEEYIVAINEVNLRYDVNTLEITLDTFKKTLCIYANSDPHEIKSKKDSFLKLFILQLSPDIKNRVLMMERSIADIKKEYILGANLDLDETLSIDDYEADLDSEEYYRFEFYTFDQLLYMYLIQILDNEIIIKRCESCKKLFIANSLREKYCDNIINGSKKTCRSLAAQEKYNRKCKSDPVIEKKRKIQKRFSKNKASTEDVINYDILNAVKKKYYHYIDMIIGDYNSGKLTQDDTLNRLEKSYKEILKLINAKAKFKSIKDGRKCASKEEMMELEKDVGFIMEKYIDIKTTK